MKKRLPVIPLILLAITTLIFVYIRLRLLSTPLDRDEGEYAYAGQQILHGGVPYRDIYNMKFPGVYYFYALIIALLGHSIIAIRTGALIINLITAFFILKTGEQLKNLTAGIFAAATFIVISSAPCFHGIIANTKHFVNLFISIGAFLIFKWFYCKKHILLFLTGIAAGLAYLMKQHGGYFIIVMVAVILIYSPLKKENILKIIKNLFFLTSGFIMVMLWLLILLLTTHTFNEFVFLTIKYGSAYISYIPFSQGIIQFFVAIGNDVRNDHPFWVLILISIFLSFKLLPAKSFWVMLIWLIFSIVAVFPGYYFRNHYFLLIVPVSAIYAGLLFDYFLSLKSRIPYLSKLVTILLFSAAVIYILIGERRIFFTDYPAMVSYDLYGMQFNEALTVSDTVHHYLQPDQSILLLGSEPEVYFYTKSKAASSYMYVYPMMEKQPYHDSMVSELLHQAIHYKPQIIVATGWWALRERGGREGVLNPLLSQPPGYYVKGICYQNGANNEPFIWNKGDVKIPRDSLLWEIYIRKTN